MPSLLELASFLRRLLRAAPGNPNLRENRCQTLGGRAPTGCVITMNVRCRFTLEIGVKRAIHRSLAAGLIDAILNADELARVKCRLQLVFCPHPDTQVKFEDQLVCFFEYIAPDGMMCLDTQARSRNRGQHV